MTETNQVKNHLESDIEEYEIISSNEKCINCRFQIKTVLEELNQINLSCKHPKGPGSPVHCIYFKSKY